jgi:hypothetical protein
LTGIHNPMLAGARAFVCVMLTAVLLMPALLAAAVLGRVPPWLKRAWHSGCCAVFGLDIRIHGEAALRGVVPIDVEKGERRCPPGA